MRSSANADGRGRITHVSAVERDFSAGRRRTEIALDLLSIAFCDGGRWSLHRTYRIGCSRWRSRGWNSFRHWLSLGRFHHRIELLARPTLFILVENCDPVFISAR